MKTLLICLLCLMAGGCADTVALDQVSTLSPAGFWHGLWHGLILPVAWLFSLATNNVAIYAVYLARDESTVARETGEI